MTPKRYFAFGCITVLLQGAVLASQNSQPSIALSAGSAMGSQAVNVSIAMRASQASEPPAAKQPQPKAEPVKEVAKAAPAAKPKPKPAIEKPTKPEPKVAKPIKQAKPTAETNDSDTATAKSATPAEPLQPVTDTKQSTTPDLEVAHNQAASDAKQGVTQQNVILSSPTFATPPAQPHYPKKARKRGLQGTATIEVMFNQYGEQLSLELVDSSGYRLLDKAALAAVEKWQFAAPQPQTAYAYTVRVPIKFALN
ncbi:TonB family protein [Shewanella waksmanii]|uniref:energy transducer TonB n=1 Tax=Shewanella waksmanii TaxID=213783 RepID=UPI0037357F4A